MTMPASSRPRNDRPPARKLALRASSLARPVREVAATKPAVSTAVRTRARPVPTTAAVVLRAVPWLRYSVWSGTAHALHRSRWRASRTWSSNPPEARFPQPFTARLRARPGNGNARWLLDRTVASPAPKRRLHHARAHQAQPQGL